VTVLTRFPARPVAGDPTSPCTCAPAFLGGSKAGGGAVEPPSITYPSPNVTWYEHVTEVSLTPTNSGGEATEWSVDPALPAGVTLNTSTGAITGTPTALAADDVYTITATNAGGSDEFELAAEVLWGPLSMGTVVAGYDLRAGFSVRKQASDGTGDDADDGDPIGYVSDLSGNGNHIPQATTSAKPAYDEDGINGGGAAVGGGDDFLQRTSFTGGAETQPNTIAAVARFASWGSDFRWLIDGGDASGRHILGIANNGNFAMFAGTSVIDSGDAADANLHAHLAVINGASSRQYLDNTEIGSGNPGAADMVGITIGASPTGGNVVESGTAWSAVVVWAGDIGASARAAYKAWAVAAFGTPS